MRRSSTRRNFVATFGTATALSLAGCSGMLGSSEDDSTPTNTTSTPSSTETPGTETAGSGTPTATQTPTPTNIPFSRGEVLADFEENLAPWRALAGKVTIDRENPYQGRRSMVLLAEGENPTPTATNTPSNATNTTNTTNTTTTTQTPTTNTMNAAGMARSYYTNGEGSGPVDLRKHDLTMAVRFEQPVRGRIGVELIAPSSSLSLTSRRFIPKELDDWTRIDLGYTGKQGEPSLKNVTGLRILVTTQGEPIDVAIDDIRKIPKAKKGEVMFQFDDGHITAYTEAFPRLKQRQWPAGAAIIPVSIGTPENMKWSHLREMNSAGWDMMSHPPVANPLPAYPPEEQERVIRETKKALTVRGFEEGARHIVAPYGRVSNTTIEIMQKYHDTNYMFGGCPNNARYPSNMYSISRVFGTSAEPVKHLLDLAEQYRQLLVINYHDIGTDTDTSTTIEEFENVLDYIETKDMDVVSPSQFLDSIEKLR